MKATEYVRFSLIQMPCCGQQVCWINPRMPNFCCECGKRVDIRWHPEHVVHVDPEARLRLEVPDPMMRVMPG